MTLIQYKIIRFFLLVKNKNVLHLPLGVKWIIVHEKMLSTQLIRNKVCAQELEKLSYFIVFTD